jgi:hypothetical protein
MAGEHFAAVLLATFPTMMFTIGCGQNGFLTGALIGLACLGLLRRKPAAGAPLGLMVIKPHLAAALALHAFATRRWSTVAVASAVVAVSTALATLAFGPRIWTVFLQGASEAGIILKAGLYPLYRMISAYAALRSAGFSAPTAMAAQGIVALLALGMAWTAIRRRMPAAQVLGLTAFAGLLVSPYAYDYDLPILGIALALLMPDLLRLTGRREQAALLALSWLTCGGGLAQAGLLRFRFGPDGPPTLDLMPFSLAGATLPLLAALVWRVLQRDRTPAADETSPLAIHAA